MFIGIKMCGLSREKERNHITIAHSPLYQGTPLQKHSLKVEIPIDLCRTTGEANGPGKYGFLHFFNFLNESLAASAL